MIKQFLLRLFIGVCFAVPVGLVAVVTAEAEPSVQGAITDDCQGCHNIIRSHWERSAHGRATDDPTFLEDWIGQGSPVECLSCHTTGYNPETGAYRMEGIACTTCHYPVPNQHPGDVMPTEISSRLCGDCHLDTYEEWHLSTHGEQGLACSTCHNPHTTELRASDVQNLCQSCHNETVHFFSYTRHYEQGLLCTDCHLKVSGDEMGDGHGKRVHTFAVDLDTCNNCHGEEMHYPATDLATTANRPAVAAMGLSGEEAVIEEEASPVSPLGFAVLAALIGMAFGMVLAPWLERWYRRASSREQ